MTLTALCTALPSSVDTILSVLCIASLPSMLQLRLLNTCSGDYRGMVVVHRHALNMLAIEIHLGMNEGHGFLSQKRCYRLAKLPLEEEALATRTYLSGSRQHGVWFVSRVRGLFGKNFSVPALTKCSTQHLNHGSSIIHHRVLVLLCQAG